MKKIILAALCAAALVGCKNDLDVTADYKDITVVYGLLNPTDTAHYIKINKAYLGDGNALLMAAISDSTNYQAADLEVKIEEYANAGSPTPLNTYVLERTVNEIQKDTGLFSADANVLYKLRTSLNTDRHYKLIINNTKTGTTVTSETDLVVLKDANVQNPPQNSTINLIPVNSYPFTVKLKSVKNALVYSLAIRFNYYDVTGSNFVQHHVDWTFPNVKSNSTNGGEDVLFPIDGDGLFRILDAQLEAPPVGTTRQAGKLEFTFYAGGEELSTYLDVNGPSNTLQQEKPEYTNINGGLGIFSSRYNLTRGNITLAPQSIDSLINGRYTYDLGFTN